MILIYVEYDCDFDNALATLALLYHTASRKSPNSTDKRSPSLINNNSMTLHHSSHTENKFTSVMSSILILLKAYYTSIQQQPQHTHYFYSAPFIVYPPKDNILLFSSPK